MAEAELAIAVRDLRVRRGRLLVFDGFSCSVASGRVTGLVGPSGCGKSTLMRAIVGVQVVAGGAVRVLGHPAGAPLLRADVGYVTQAPSVYADLSVEENVRYFAAVLDARADVDRVLDQVDLHAARKQLVGTLSGGQRARVSLACALLGSPQLLVLDEPTVGLDPVLRRDLWALFHKLAATGTALLVSSHVMEEAAQCDELLLLRDGRLVFAGPPDGLRQRTGEPDLSAAFLRLAEAESA
jgi:ABC-2 type transport system ATP-binding protein